MLSPVCTRAILGDIFFRYLQAPSVSEKFNITWGNQVRDVQPASRSSDPHPILQTFGGQFEADGRLQGSEVLQSFPCNQNAGTCSVRVPAPSFALVFLSDPSLEETVATQTFATTALTHVMYATVDPAVLATSNGHSGEDFLQGYGSTSPGSGSSATRTFVLPSLIVVGAMVSGAIMLMRALAGVGQ